MLLEFSLIILTGFALKGIFEKIRLPGLLGMLLAGIILGPYALDLLGQEVLAIAPDLRQVALIVILTRVGITLDLRDLKKVGRPALLMCIVPAALEIAAITFIAPLILDISYIEAAILGSVIGAVSPAIIVPRMLMLLEKGYGI